MLTSLKNITERAQKCDFSVNFQILIQKLTLPLIVFFALNIASGFRFYILCQKVDIKRHCVFPLNTALKETFQL